MTNQSPQIPRNNDNNFIFFKNDYFTSVDLLFEWELEINMENLFLIFKTYITHQELALKHIYIIATNASQYSAVFHHVRTTKIKKMSYIDFSTWYEEIFENDYEYLTSYKYYGFRFAFYKESSAWQNLIIFPKYPWNLHFKKIFIHSERGRNNGNKKEITMLRKKVKKYELMLFYGQKVRNFVIKKKK